MALKVFSSGEVLFASDLNNNFNELEVKADAAAVLDDVIVTTVDGISDRLDVSTTKGDLAVYDGTDYVPVGVGTNSHVLTADSTEATGVKWEAPQSGGMTLIASGTLSGASLTISGLSTSAAPYKYLYFTAENITASTPGVNARFRINSDNTTNYSYIKTTSESYSFVDVSEIDNGPIVCNQIGGTGTVTNLTLKIYNYKTTRRFIQAISNKYQNNFLQQTGITHRQATAFNSINLVLQLGTFNGGTYELYGVA